MTFHYYYYYYYYYYYCHCFGPQNSVLELHHSPLFECLYAAHLKPQEIQLRLDSQGRLSWKELDLGSSVMLFKN